MEKILFLGASPYQLSPILYARDRGYHVITCDNVPNNPGHTLADEYHNVSTTDLDAVLGLAKSLSINGIVAYASDPAAPTAAYVAEKMGLAGNPYESVKILANKDLYRKFLKEKGFNTPRTGDDARFPCVVKPVDSSGSKGVTVVWDINQLHEAIVNARSYSRSDRFIVEEFINRDGYQIAGDGFVSDGELVFSCLANEHFNEDGIVPIGESFPYIGTRHQEIYKEVQRLVGLLGMKTGALNFDIAIRNGKIYLMEVGPRNGGNLIPDVTRLCTGEDMATATVEAALGHPIDLTMREPTGFYSSYIVHSKADGICKGLYIDEDALDIVHRNLNVSTGDQVSAFTGSHRSLGMMILRFDSQLEMLDKMNHMDRYVKVLL